MPELLQTNENISSVWECKEGLNADDDFVKEFDKDQGIHKHMLERHEIDGGNKYTDPGRHKGVEETSNEDNVKAFERMHVKNMIRTCVDRLGLEYEQNGHNNCRKGSSVGTEINMDIIENTEEDVDNERKMLLEVHMLLLCPLLKCWGV